MESQVFSLSSGLFGSLFFTINCFHLARVIIGLLMPLVLLIWSSLGLFNTKRHGPISIGAVWIAVFASLYLSLYLG